MAASLKKSKRPSVASSPKPPDRTVLFVDRSLGGKVVPDALRAAGERVERHDDHFPADTPDHVWLADVGARGWLILTKDKRIRRRPAEIHALRAAGAKAFFLSSSKDLTGPQMAEIFVRALPKMKRIARNTPAPFLAHVMRDGSVHVMPGSNPAEV